MKRRKSVDESINEIVEKQKIRNQKEKQLLESDEYILWLQNFTEKYNLFFNDSWLYKPKKISTEDLDLLYCTI